jgi:micrococcal nuclease
LVVLLVIAGWAYDRYFRPEPPRRETTQRETTRRETRTDRPRSERRDTSPSHPLEGGKRMNDVVVAAYDGDTLTLKRTGKVRLIGVDTPERKQQGGEEATNFTRDSLLNKTIKVELCAAQPADRYGRGLAFIYLPDGRLFNAELVKQGYARVYSLRPCTVDEAEWNGYYEEARRQRRGLFATLGEVPDPKSYRKSHGMGYGARR